MFDWTYTFAPSAHRHPRAPSAPPPTHVPPPPPHMGTISWRSWKSNSQFQAPVLVESAKLRKHQHENKTGGNWGEKGLSPLICPPPPLFPRSRPYYIFARHTTSFLLLKADKQKKWHPQKMHLKCYHSACFYIEQIFIVEVSNNMGKSENDQEDEEPESFGFFSLKLWVTK